MTDTRVILGFVGSGKLEFQNIDKKKYAYIQIRWFKKKLSFESALAAVFDRKYGNYEYILIDTHFNVIRFLEKRNVPFTLIYPNIKTKEKYLIRLKHNQFSEKMIEIIDNIWTKRISEFMSRNLKHKESKKIELKENEYIKDILV